MGREVGVGFRMWNTRTCVADSCQHMAKPLHYCKVISLQLIKINEKKKKGNVKECSNYHTSALISHASKVMLKILQARLLRYTNCELPDVQDGFRKGRGTRDQIANIHWIIKKQEFHKNIYF